MKKDEKIYEEYNVELKVVENSREDYVKKIVNMFISEKPGYWKNSVKHVTRYRYYVERLKDGRRIFLFRPTFLNKGIDFQVWVEKFDGIKDKRPSHQDVFKDLILKNKENPKDFGKLLSLIAEVWNCKEPDEILHKTDKLDFKKGLPIEMLLKILKWLFIEQDITYWNYDGRGMLKIAIDDILK